MVTWVWGLHRIFELQPIFQQAEGFHAHPAGGEIGFDRSAIQPDKAGRRSGKCTGDDLGVGCQTELRFPGCRFTAAEGELEVGAISWWAEFPVRAKA